MYGFPPDNILFFTVFFTTFTSLSTHPSASTLLSFTNLASTSSTWIPQS